MQELSDIYKRFKQMKYAPVTGGITFEALAHALVKEETMLKLLEGNFHATVGLIIATDLRIFYIGVNMYNQTTIEQIQYEDIVKIDITEPKFISVEISIHSRNEKILTVKGCDYSEGKEFVELIRMLTLYNPLTKAS
ncbi:MAG: hypothetical protein EAZ07_03630 [Cytophagales bacterium]|nr:MAG: hypothetical protein EAZ07_03630 [Cytophagales bacterium]